MTKLIPDYKSNTPYNLTSVAVTASAGSLPTANGAVTIADAATPTVTELLELCMELKAQLDILSN